MKKFIFLFAISAIVAGIGGLIVSHPTANAAPLNCNPFWGTTCGYFYDTNKVNAYCNVLPDYRVWNWSLPNNPWACQGYSNLYRVNNVNTFINVMWNYLNDNGGGGANINARVGAAFLIEYMLGKDQYISDRGGNWNQGVIDARTDWNQWQSTIRALGVNSCNGNGSQINPACGGTSFGINFNFTPLETSSPARSTDFCAPQSKIDSGYDPSWGDAALYPIGLSDYSLCDDAYKWSQPEIVVYWNNGANSFRIGSQCGNAIDAVDTLPTNTLPQGTISVACVTQNNGGVITKFEQATITFSDADAKGGVAPPKAYIGMAGWNSFGWPGPSSGGSATINIPTWATNMYASQPVYLYVQDVGPLGSGAYYQSPPPASPANTQVPCAVVTCGTATPTPQLPDAYMTFPVTVAMTVSPAPPTPPSIKLTVTPYPGGAYNRTMTATMNGTSMTATFAVGPLGRTGPFNTTWQLTGSGLNQTCNGSFSAVNMPYLSIYGGDANVGVAPSFTGSGSVCAPPDSSGGAYTAGIFGWNNHANYFGGSPTYSGAGAQYAVQALAAIEDFASGQAATATIAPPTGLSRANYLIPGGAPGQVNPGSGLFGGSSNVQVGDCDFTSDITVPQDNQAQGNTAIAALPASLTVGNHPDVIYVSGDVYIGRNIQYSTPGWSTTGQIPYFKLVVVGGNIYIGSGVTQLDGIYVAEPQGGSGGVIYTCASSLNNPAIPTAIPAYYAQCHQPLTINGAFVAKQVQFLRTGGSVGQANPGDTAATSHAAEIFNFTPEVWLPRGGVPTDTGYKAITGLPPIL